MIIPKEIEEALNKLENKILEYSGEPDKQICHIGYFKRVLIKYFSNNK